MERKPNILMVHNFYQQAGGEDTVFHQESAMLEDAGHRVVRYTRTNDDIKGALGKLKALFAMVFNLRTYREVKRIIRDERIDVVHCHNTFPMISAAVYWAARHEHVPVIQTVHNFRLLCPNASFYRDGTICEECLNRGFQSAVKHRCYRHSRLQTAGVALLLQINRKIGSYSIPHYVFLTEFNRDKHKAFLESTGASCSVISNCCDDYSHLARSYAAREPIVLYFGRLSKEKGIAELLNVWTSFCKSNHESELRLVVVGDGEKAEEVRKIVCDPANRCDFPGKMSHDDLIELIGRSLVTVVPSNWYEGLPMALVESFSCKTPVLGSAVGNVGSIVSSSEGGEAYSNDSGVEFARALARVTGDWETYSARCSRYFKKNYSSGLHLAELERLHFRMRNNQDLSK